MTDLIIRNLVAYSVQAALVLAVGGLALHLLRLRIPQWRLLCWQALLLACLLLPAFQTWQAVDGSGSITVSTRVLGSTVAPGATAWSWNARPELLLAVVLAGILIRLGMFSLGLLRLRSYRRRSNSRQNPVRAIVQKIAPRARVATSEDVSGPVTFGFLRPVVLLPVEWATSEAVLCHELVHVRRGDWLFMASEELIRALFWFHPLIWYAISQIQLAREEVVDREVVKLTQSREQYLETLLAIAAAQSGLDLAPAPLFLRKRHLRKRVASLLKEATMSRLRLNTSLAGFAALALAAGWAGARAFPLHAAALESPAQDDSNKRIRVGGNVQALKLKKKVTPTYPMAAKQARVQGTVTLRAVIDKEGKIKDLEVVSGPEELTESALTAVRQWEYETTLLNGEPVEVETQIDVNYTLSK